MKTRWYLLILGLLAALSLAALLWMAARSHGPTPYVTGKKHGGQPGQPRPPGRA